MAITKVIPTITENNFQINSATYLVPFSDSKQIGMLHYCNRISTKYSAYLQIHPVAQHLTYHDCVMLFQTSQFVMTHFDICCDRLKLITQSEVKSLSINTRKSRQIPLSASDLLSFAPGGKISKCQNALHDTTKKEDVRRM